MNYATIGAMTTHGVCKPQERVFCSAGTGDAAGDVKLESGAARKLGVPSQVVPPFGLGL